MFDNNLIVRIRLIIESLKSKELLDLLNHWSIDKLKLLSLVIESKIGYDRVMVDIECKKFIEDIEEYTIYSIAEYSRLIIFISSMGEMNSNFNNDGALLNKFQLFHKMIYKASTLVIKLLSDFDKIEQTSKPPEAPDNSSLSKVVPINFSKLSPLEQPLDSFKIDSNTPNFQVSENEMVKYKDENESNNSHNVARYSTPQPMPSGTKPEVSKDEVNEISLTSFLRSLSLMDIPSESLI